MAAFGVVLFPSSLTSPTSSYTIVIKKHNHNQSHNIHQNHQNQNLMVYADSHKNMMMMMLNDDRVGWCAKAPPCLVARINFSSVTYMCRAQIPTDDDDDGGCSDGFHQQEDHASSISPA